MHGPTCVFWANLTPSSLQPAVDEDAEPVEKAILPITMESLRFWLRVMEKSWPRVCLYQLY